MDQKWPVNSLVFSCKMACQCLKVHRVHEIVSNDTWRWNLAVGTSKEDSVGLCQRRVLVWPMKVLRIGWKSRGNRLTSVYLKFIQHALKIIHAKFHAVFKMCTIFLLQIWHTIWKMATEMVCDCVLILIANNASWWQSTCMWAGSLMPQ